SCRYFGHECSTIDHFFADPVTPRQSCPPGFPSSSDVCIPEDGGCAFRNPCVLFQGHCGGEYTCGSLADYAIFLTSALPPCAPPAPLSLNPVPRVPRPSPPGECIYQDGQCKWSRKLTLYPLLFSVTSSNFFRVSYLALCLMQNKLELWHNL
ncbi:hypothetical protein GBAR_LOCUS18852, partial [Geodia barretti]